VEPLSELHILVAYHRCVQGVERTSFAIIEITVHPREVAGFKIDFRDEADCGLLKEGPPIASGRPFGFAGIWSANRNDAGTPLTTCAIVTCAPNELMAPIHNRMPVILPTTARDLWLDPSAGADDLSTLLVPLPSEEMEAYAVSTVVNPPRNDSPECVQRLAL
jgi:hypothetical protein